jgi:hypothetical protein
MVRLPFDVVIRADEEADNDASVTGRPSPQLSVEKVVRAGSAPAVNPGFTFFPDPPDR